MYGFIFILIISIYYSILDFFIRKIPNKNFIVFFSLGILNLIISSVLSNFSKFFLLILFLLNFFTLFLSCLVLFWIRFIGGGDSKYIFLLFLLHFGFFFEILNLFNFFFFLFLFNFLFSFLNYLINQVIHSNKFDKVFLILKINKISIKFYYKLCFRIIPLKLLIHYDKIRFEIKRFLIFYDFDGGYCFYLAQYRFPAIFLCFLSYISNLIF